jgi:NDP-sugar pyrophosphorylase family protein
MESLFTLAPLLGGQRFLLLTVDAILAPTGLQRFCEQAAARQRADGILAVTEWIDDEKPLWVKCAAEEVIETIGIEAAGSGLVTAGVYVFEPRIFDEVEAARALRFDALRQFLAHLVRRGFRLEAAPIGKSVDVDRPEDIAVAEAFVRNGFA